MQFNKEKYILLYQLNEYKDLVPILIENDVFIAGGAITSIFTNNKINDYDIYFREYKNMLNIKLFLEENKFKLLFKSDNALSYKRDNVNIQLIKKIYGKPEDIINQFDYTICMGAYDFSSRKFIFNEHFLQHNAQRQLIFNINAKYPICSLYRMLKYIKRGYIISGGEIIKLSLCVNNLKMETFADLKEQLEGIDTMFLKDLTDRLLSYEYANKKYDFLESITIIDKYLNEMYLREVNGY